MTLTPAYGRDYKNKAEAIADWESDKDFMAHTFNAQGYINKSQAEKTLPKGTTLQIRYKKQTQIVIVTI